nr:MAG TPA: endosialidase chaperone [Caudoviricetes sp.]
MVNYKYGDLFKKDTVDKQLSIVSDDGKINITNTELHQEKFELTESLCSEQELTFGSCEAAMIKFTVSNTFLPMKGKWLTVRMSLDGHTDAAFQFGRYKVDSDTPTADRTCREVIAYDALYDVLTADVAAWYNTVFPSHEEQKTDEDGTITTVTVYDPVTMKQFRNSFFKHFGIEQADITLINDNMSIEKTVAVTTSSETSSDTEESSTIGESMSGKEVLSCICEINGCMGHMGRDGKFHYIYLEQEIQGLYPRNDLYPADNLYPRDPKSTQIGKGFYVSAKYEDYLVRTINKLQIREQKNDIGVIVGSGSNAYVIEDNFLVYGKGTKELKGIAKNILSKIRGIVYRPFTADCKGNPCLEVGDAVRLPTRYELIESYILKRTLKGIQALRDDLEADGEEYRTNGANGIQKSILKLKGKSNVLERTIEKTQSTITDVEKGLQSQITQTATEIRTEVKNTTDGLSSRITQNASSITAEVKRAQGQEVELAAAIKINEDKITAEVTRASEAEGDLSGKIEVTATKIRSEVSASLTVWDTEDYDVTHCGFGNPQDTYPASSYYSGHSFLDQNTGKFYGCEPDGGISSGKYKWTLIKKFKQLSSSASSTITQSSKQISLKVSKDSVISEINQSAEGIKIKAKLLELKGSMEMTGGYMHIQTEESAENLIEFKRSGTLVQMGTDGFRTVEGTLESPVHKCTVQYNQVSLHKGANDNDHMMIHLDGDTGVGGFRGGVINGSDKRIKNTILDLSKKQSSEFIYSLRAKSYRYNFEKDGFHHGFIAQDVLESVEEGWNICPQIFSNGNGEKYYGLNYTELIADLVATVQLQHEEIEQLKEKVENL